MDLTTHALDVQLDLLRYYTRTEEGRFYANSIVDSAIQTDTGKSLSDMGVLLHRMILTGETYAVSEDIVDVLEFAASSVPTFKIERSDLPSESGFVYLGRSIVIKDKRDNDLVVRALGWRLAVTHGRGETVEAIQDIAADSPELAAAMEQAEADGKLPGEALAVVVWTAPLDGRDHMHDEFVANIYDLYRPACEMLSLVAGVWEIGRDDWGTFAAGHGMDLGKFVMSFLRFINEPWVDYRQMVPGRHLRKRAARAAIEEPAIHIVQLRRSLSHGRRPANGDGPSAEWSHRWLVRGHWRNQWYPSAKVHRPRWIPEYVKGPDDKPLVVHDKIFSVDR